ncbi:YcxB family protein [Candidatus Peregrinibacteria bacterium]|nr:MAG: YcxB family protein [Candidatus Peregrinibacteria bacterium]
MKLNFKLTAKELTFMYMELYLHSAAYKKVCVKSRLILSFGVLMFTLGIWLMTQEKMPSLTVLILGTVLVVFYPKIIKRTFRNGYKKYFQGSSGKRFLETQSWVLDSKKITLSQAGIKSEFQWKVFNEVREYPDYYLLSLASLQGLLLPKSAFKDKKQENEAKAFFKKVPQKKS